MNFSIQPTLENDKALLLPLRQDDFNAVFAVASDPLVWEQHPNKDRWQKEVFTTFFEGAINSAGAFKIIDKSSGAVAGCSRFYNYQPQESSIMIGYTFYATRCWGTGLNRSVKKLMLDYVFQYVDRVLFQVGAGNRRSQIAMERLGAVKTGEEEVAYYGEPTKLNFVYEILKDGWAGKL